MASRLKLHELLCGITGVKNAYFQPPESVKMNYPCIVYKRNNHFGAFADNIRYMHKTQYQLIVIDKDPDSLIPGHVAEIPLCSFVRHYTSDGLNHDVFNLYF